MKRKILVLVLVTIFAWSMCDVGDAYAEILEGMPSEEGVVAIGVAVVFVITVIIVAIVKSGGGEEAEEPEEPEEVTVSGIEETAPQMRIDPVLTLGHDTLGAGLALSF